MIVKSVIAGEYTAPPAHGPMTTEICGTTPEASTLRRKISAYPPSEATPSWMSRPARIVETDDRRADLHRQVHDLADLLGIRLGQRSTEDREVLAEDEDEPAVDRAVAGDDAVAQHVILGETEFRGSVGDEGIELDE